MSKNCCQKFALREDSNVIYVEVKARDEAEEDLYYLYFIRVHIPGEEFSDYDQILYCPFCGADLLKRKEK